MNNISGFLSNDWANALGWTLMHSLWQSLVILLIVAALLRSVPLTCSGIRYAITCGGLFLFMAAVFFTFGYLMDGATSPSMPLITEVAYTKDVVGQTSGVAVIESALFSLSSFVDRNIPLILSLWIAGIVFSAFRLSGGIYFTLRLRSTAYPLENEWGAYIKDVSRTLGINRLILLAESAAISTPMVIGYFKPMIVIPVGMLTGLTTEQLETIFMHELAHIKRHDYLINFLQSMIETIFFFNPFIRILSGHIRREREYCCDDLVVARHGGARAYAHALTRLAEVRVLTPAFALPLGDGKNHLLNRIRRIMEKSVRNYSAKGRMLVPAVLLVAGLLCVSWLGISPDQGYKKDPALADQDTVKKSEKKGARYSRKRIITLDENGQPHEEVVEEFEGDEALRPLMAIPAIPDISVLPPIPDVPVTPPIPDIQGMPDTIPPPAFPFRREEWEDFSDAFRESFRKSFEGLHALRDGEAFEKLKAFEDELMSKDWPHSLFDDSIAFNLEKEIEHFREFDLENLNQQLDVLKEFEMKGLEQHLENLQEFNMEHLEKLEEDLRFHEGNLRKFEEAIHQELVEDGYLSENETIESLEWTNDSFKVNGKAVKETDIGKYRELHEKFRGDRKGLRKLE